MKALYRKYRPNKLSEVVGQEQVTGPLENSLAQGKISHAYLFIGPRGTGKTSVARIFAHQVNNFEYQLEDDYVDIVEIDGASNRGIDNIRELREKAAIAPTSGKYKVYIIDEVHMLTTEAANALLKTLEEPPEHVIFIMATTDVHKVPITISSRTQLFTFKLADKKTMFSHLEKVAKKEGIKIDSDALKIVVKHGGGSFRDSLSLLDQISTLSTEKISRKLVEQAMGLPENEKIVQLLEKYLAGDVVNITTIYQDLLKSGVKPETLAGEIIMAIIEAPKPALMKLLAKLPEVKDPYAEAKLLVALMPEVDPGYSERPIAQPLPKKTTPSFNTTTPEATSAPSKPAISKEPSTKKETANTQKPEQPVATSEKKSVERSPITAENFDWSGYLAKIESLNEVVYAQLKRCEYELIGNELRLYPRTKIIRNILNSPNNKALLSEATGGNVKITLEEPGVGPKKAGKDEMLEKISAIMGGEVMREDGGSDPF